MTIISIPRVAGLVAANSRSSSLIASFMIALINARVTAMWCELLKQQKMTRETVSTTSEDTNHGHHIFKNVWTSWLVCA